MITSLDQVSEFPLCWPQQKPRVGQRKDSLFKGCTVPGAIRQISDQMRSWRVTSFVISQEPMFKGSTGDPAVAVWWNARRNQQVELRVLACDTFKTRAENLRAIAVTLTDLRRIERYGAYTAEQAAEGMRALPPPPRSGAPEGPPWFIVLGVKEDWPLDAIEAIYRTKVDKAHPDKGGSHDAMAALSNAITEARRLKERK